MVTVTSYFKKVLIIKSCNCDNLILQLTDIIMTSKPNIIFYIIVGVNVKEAEKAKEGGKVEQEERGKAEYIG